MPNSPQTAFGSLLLGAAVIVLAVAAVLAWHLSDPHIINRGGALISAMAAGAILVQILHEIRIEDSRRKLENEKESMPDEIVSPIGRLAERLAQGKRNREIEALKKSRLQIASYVVSCAIAGEVLHGFGDLLFCTVIHCNH
jgi:hypothetical protein